MIPIIDAEPVPVRAVGLYLVVEALWSEEDMKEHSYQYLYDPSRINRGRVLGMGESIPEKTMVSIGPADSRTVVYFLATASHRIRVPNKAWKRKDLFVVHVNDVLCSETIEE